MFRWKSQVSMQSASTQVPKTHHHAMPAQETDGGLSRLGCFVLALLMQVSSTPGLARDAFRFQRNDRNRGEALRIPILDEEGRSWTMEGRVCRPDNVVKPRLVVINHGAPGQAVERLGMRLGTCDSEAAQWFLRRRFAVVEALRLGYGRTGGPWTEGYSNCDDADFYRIGLETARQIKTIVDFAAALPGVDHDGVIVVGESAGGWGTLAYDSIAHSNVLAFINMAGGRGGHMDDRANSNCHVERLLQAAAQYGRTASSPMLWVYARNDTYFGPELAAKMDRSFVEAGGKVDFVTPEAFSDEGHKLFFGRSGSDTWGPVVEKYLLNVGVQGAH